MALFADELTRLDTIHGLNQRTAEVLTAELGVDMAVLSKARFRTHDILVSERCGLRGHFGRGKDWPRTLARHRSI